MSADDTLNEHSLRAAIVAVWGEVIMGHDGGVFSYMLDRIEELEADNERLREALSRATAECNKLNNYDSYQPHDFMQVTP